ncbi:MAG: hypothetical protein AAB036_07280 [Elusimicrobiota bacterium]
MKLIAIVITLIVSVPASAAGLRTKFGEVVVSGLKIGQTYSLKELVNLPYAVVNTGESEVDLLLDVIPVSDDVLKQGYEATLSTGWVKLNETRFSVAPNREVATDLTISIPNDPELLGRRFQADIWARTQSPRGMFAVGLRSRLLIHVDSTPPTEEEMKRKFVKKNLSNLDFTLLPTFGNADDVALGRTVDMRKEHKVSIKVINPNEAALNFRIRSIPNWESLLKAPEGYEDAYNPQWLRPAKDIVKVEGNSILETGLSLNIPDKPEHRGKKFFFSVGIEILEAEIPVRVYYRLFVQTAAGAAEIKKEENKK